MYIQQAYNYLYDWWRYILGGAAIFLISQLGFLPFLGIVAIKLISEGKDVSAIEDPNVLMSVLDSNLTLFLMLLSYAIGLLAVLFYVRLVHKQPLIALTTSRKKIDWGRFWFGFGLIAMVTVTLTLIDYYSNPQDYVVQFDLIPFTILTVIAIIMVPLQTSFEEYYFRGYLMQGIGTMARNKWVPLFITSLIFGGLHFFNPEVTKLGNIIMIYYIGTGLFLGIITLMDEGLELAMGFHAGNNLIVALLVTADWTVFQTHSVLKDVSEPSAGIDIIAPVFIVYPIFLGIMAWRYKWTNWKDKLFGSVDPPSENMPPEGII
jgi:uncharacterized protein